MNPGGIIEPGTAATTLHADDIRRLPEPELLTAAVQISHEIARLETLRVAAVTEIDQRPVALDTLGFRSVKMWLASTTLLEVPAAARILALGKALRRQPEITDAYENQHISADHAALIAKFCEKPPRDMPDEALESCRNILLDCATGPTANTDTLRGTITKLERLFESDELPASEDTDRNELHASKTLNGRIAVKGDFDNETGEMLLTALSTLTKPRNPIDDPANTRTPGQRRAQAFTDILRHYLNSGDAPIEGGQRPHLSLHVNTRDLTQTETSHPTPADRTAHTDLLDDTDVAWTPHMGPLTIASARRIACDSIITPILMTDGIPLDLGRTTRTVSRKQRRALIARDNGCAFPSCGSPPAWCEGHHITHWADGGPTNLDNLVLLCTFHHRLLHHSHWQVQIGTDRHPPPSTSCRGYPQVHTTQHSRPLQETHPSPQPRRTKRGIAPWPPPEGNHHGHNSSHGGTGSATGSPCGSTRRKPGCSRWRPDHFGITNEG